MSKGDRAKAPEAERKENMAHNFNGHHGNGSGHAKWFERYRDENRREKNKARKAATIARKLAKNRARREAQEA